MTGREAAQAVRMARAYAAEQLPWFASALFAVRLVLSDRVPVAAIDEGMRLYFNPRIVESMAGQAPASRLRQLAWIWIHELSHNLREHGPRARDRGAEPFRWNAAADLEINDAVWEGLEPPRAFPPMLPGHFGFAKNKLAEFYYDRLRRSAKTILAQGTGWTGHGEPDSPGDSPPVWPWDEGSAVHGHRRGWELDQEDASTPAVPALEQHALRRHVADEISKQCGDLPAGWLRWAEAVQRPQIHWKERLRRRLRGAIVTGTGQRIDYTWQRPHRRAEAYDPFLRPALAGDLLPRVACVVDTSGSISTAELTQLLSEVRGVLESLRTPVVVIPCDAVAYEPIRVLTDSDFLSLRRRLRGGGGTNMVAGIEAALALRPPADTIIVLTDGYTPYPPRPYHVPVIFGIISPRGKLRAYCKPPIPPWRTSDVVEIGRESIEGRR